MCFALSSYVRTLACMWVCVWLQANSSEISILCRIHTTSVSQSRATLSARSIDVCGILSACFSVSGEGDANLCSAWIFAPFFISSDTDNGKEMVKWENALHPQITETSNKKKLVIIIIMYLLASCLCGGGGGGGGGCCLLCVIKWMWTDLCYVWRLFSDHHPFF